MAQTSKIDALPAKDRRAVIKALTQALTEQVEPNYRVLCTQLAQQIPSFAEANIAHVTLFRFARKYVKPGISRSVAEIAAAQINESRAREQKLNAVADETERALSDDPIIKALMVKRLRMESAIAATHGDAQWDAYAKLEGVDLKALELLGRASMHPGFSTQAGPSSVTQVVLIMPRAGDVQRRIEGTGVIEAEVVE